MAPPVRVCLNAEDSELIHIDNEYWTRIAHMHIFLRDGSLHELLPLPDGRLASGSYLQRAPVLPNCANAFEAAMRRPEPREERRRSVVSTMHAAAAAAAAARDPRRLVYSVHPMRSLHFTSPHSYRPTRSFLTLPCQTEQGSSLHVRLVLRHAHTISGSL